MAEKPEDLNLPTAVITRLVKEVVPEGVNISKEARSAISKSASVFILYLTSCANNLAQKNKRKTLAGQDVFQALEEMEFEQFIDPLKACLEAHRKEQKGKEAKKKEAAEKRKQHQENADDLEKKKKKSTENDDEDDDVDEVMDITDEKTEEGDK